jgi:hypothetical protein
MVLPLLSYFQDHLKHFTSYKRNGSESEPVAPWHTCRYQSDLSRLAIHNAHTKLAKTYTLRYTHPQYLSQLYLAKSALLTLRPNLSPWILPPTFRMSTGNQMKHQHYFTGKVARSPPCAIIHPSLLVLGYDTELPPEHKDWKDLSKVEYCLACPPMEGRTDSSISKRLTITSSIRTGQQIGAQVVVVDSIMVAKIYDPLYYSALNECGYPEDVLLESDGDYCREAAAYAQLQKSPEVAAVVPHCYGSWTMDVETPIKQHSHKEVKHVRAVRFILMERIIGDCIAHNDAYDLHERVRSDILKQTLTAEALLRGAGVCHRDICPRNIFVVGSDYDDPDIPIHDINVSIKIIRLRYGSSFHSPPILESKVFGLLVAAQSWMSW